MAVCKENVYFAIRNLKRSFLWSTKERRIKSSICWLFVSDLRWFYSNLFINLKSSSQLPITYWIIAFQSHDFYTLCRVCFMCTNSFVDFEIGYTRVLNSLWKLVLEYSSSCLSIKYCNKCLLIPLSHNNICLK